MLLRNRGICSLKKYGVKLIGATQKVIQKAEDRELFKKSMSKIGLDTPKGFVVKSLDQATEALKDLTFPVIIRPSFTLGGTGGGIVYDKDEFISSLLNKSLFETEKLIIISRGTDKLITVIDEVLDRKEITAKIIIKSSNLEKKSKLRNLFEKEKNFIHSYYIFGDCHREIAKKNNLPNEKSIGVTIHRSLVKLEKCLNAKRFENPF